MSFSFKCVCVIISLLLQISGGRARLCYTCNTRDHEGCDDIRFGKNKSLVQVCREPCCMMKGQWGAMKSYMLWRGCSRFDHCTQATATCCTCVEDYCNYDNVCYNSRGNLRIPGLVMYCVLNFILLVIVY